MELRLERCTIRDWRFGDEESLTLNANNPNVWRNLRDAFPHPYTRADAERWINSAASGTPTTSFAIEVGGSAVGGIGIVPGVDIYRRSAEIGYWLGEPFWGRGIATEALSALTAYVFTNFDIVRLWAGVFEWNIASSRVLEKAGYQREARFRLAATKGGKTIDEFIYAIIRE
jgi:RimJ/RimL family protein N-acetyltransferase